MKDTLQSFFVTGLVMGLNILTGVLAARLLLPEGRGDLAAVILWPSLMMGLGYFSIDQAITYFTARERNDSARMFSVGLSLNILQGPLIVLIGWFVLPLLYKEFDQSVIDLARLFLCIMVAPTFIGDVLLAVIKGQLSFIQWNIIRLSHPLFYLCGILVALVLGHATVEGFVAALIFAAFANFAVTMGLYAKSGTRFWERPSRSQIKGVVRFSLVSHVSALVGIIDERIGQIVIALGLSARELGFFVVAGTFNGAFPLVANTIATLVFSKVANQKAASEQTALFCLYFRFTFVIVLCGALALAVLGHWLIVTLFGEAFQSTYLILLILLPGSAFVGLTNLLYVGMRARGYLASINKMVTFSFGLKIILLAILMPVYGLPGTALAISLSQLIVFTTVVWLNKGRLYDTIGTLLLPGPDDIRHALSRLRALMP